MKLWNKALFVLVMTWSSAIDKVSTLLLCLWISVSNTCWNNDERLMYTAEKTSCLFQSCCHHLSVALQLSLSMQHIDPGPLISCRDSFSMDSNNLLLIWQLCVFSESVPASHFSTHPPTSSSLRSWQSTPPMKPDRNPALGKNQITSDLLMMERTKRLKRTMHATWTKILFTLCDLLPLHLHGVGIQ